MIKGKLTISFFCRTLVATSLFISASALTGCDDSTENNAPTIATNAVLAPSEIAARIKTLSDVGAVQLPNPTNGNNFVVAVTETSLFGAGDKAQSILHTVHNHIGSSPYSGVIVDVALKLVDGYGRSSAPPLLRLTYSKDDIDKIDFDHIMTTQILNLALVSSLNPVSNKIAGEECKEGSDLAQAAALFCHVATDAPDADP